MTDPEVVALVYTALELGRAEDKNPLALDVLRAYRNHMRNARTQIAVTQNPGEEENP